MPPLSIASNSQQNRLDRVVEVLRPLPRRRATSPLVSHHQTKKDCIKLFRTIRAQTKNVERQSFVLVPMSLNSFSSTDRGQPGSGFKIARRTSSATRESRPRLQLRRLGDVRSGKIAAQRLEETCGLIVINLKQNFRSSARLVRSPMWQIQTPRSRVSAKSFVHITNSCARKQGSPLCRTSRNREDSKIVGIGRNTYVCSSCQACDIAATKVSRCTQ
jgi:predicted RNA-binding protein YlxR (DUF448 family)